MSRVSHLRSLFEEKVRQANDEKERSKATSPRHHRSPSKWRDSLNRSEDTSADKNNINTSSDSVSESIFDILLYYILQMRFSLNLILQLFFWIARRHLLLKLSLQRVYYNNHNNNYLIHYIRNLPSLLLILA
jgi:hypothetical protein